MKKLCINIIVFSQSTPISQIVSLIQLSSNEHPFLCLSTHKLFDIEEAGILDSIHHTVHFSNFADFLTDDEMAVCDMQAYRIESQENGSILRGANKYYQYIKYEKNKNVINNIKKIYQLAEKHLCAVDLGISVDVWLNEGFRNHTSQEQRVIEDISAISKTHTIIGSQLTRLIRGCKQIYISFRQLHDKLFLFETPVGNFLFLGSITRIQPHLEGVTIHPLKTRWTTDVINSIRILTLKLVKLPLATIIFKMQVNIISLHATIQQTTTCLSTIHEYQWGYTELANSMNLDLVILQDGYIPENYSSRYLAYCFGVQEFWVWDRLSLGLFESQQFTAKVCPFLASPRLPEIKKDNYEVKSILVLTSGAGDWTALKNRSDEDLMVIAFMSVAEQFPEIQIIYRCHPLWSHAEHQGINSIKRVDKYFKEKNIENIVVSSESLIQSKQYIEKQELGLPRDSLDQDLNIADLVFGEHSFTMIEAAKQGKLFASINLTRRRNFFQSYSKLGFPHLTSKEEIISFIKAVQVSTQRILNSHNAAVQNYNINWD